MKNVKIRAIVAGVILLLTLCVGMSVTVYAAEMPSEAVVATAEQTGVTVGMKALAAAIAVGVAAAAGAVAMGVAIAKCVDGIARQPEASGKINGAMMLGLVFIETLIIYALIVAILIIFVL